MRNKFKSSFSPIAVVALQPFHPGEIRPDIPLQIPRSKFLDPGYFTQSLGLGYQPHNDIKSRFGIALKETITSDFPVPYSDDPDTPEFETSRVETGLELVTDLNRKLHENILLISKLELFSNVKAFNKIDVNWDTLVSAKITKLIAVNFNIKLIYDRDVSVKRQLKQALTVGLTYTLL